MSAQRAERRGLGAKLARGPEGGAGAAVSARLTAPMGGGQTRGRSRAQNINLQKLLVVFARFADTRLWTETSFYEKFSVRGLFLDARVSGLSRASLSRVSGGYIVYPFSCVLKCEMTLDGI